MATSASARLQEPRPPASDGMNAADGPDGRSRFVRNAWYIAAWADDVTRSAPLGRTLLNEPLVLWRTEDGIPVALEDRCCHRHVPLSLGRITGRTLQCGYHGLEFDATGQCVKIPGQARIPPGAHVPAFPAVERHRWIWVWMGDPGRADPGQIPDYRWLDSPDWTAPVGEFHLKAHYQLLVDNLLDFSHLQFVHRRTIGTDAIADIPSSTERCENRLEITRWIMDSPPPPLFDRAYGGFGGNVDRWMNCSYTAPSSVTFDIGCALAGTGAPEGDRSQGIEIRSLHGITPETDRTTLYFWGYARNFRLDDDALTELLAKGASATFAEDVEVLAEQQAMLDRSGRTGFVDIGGDSAGLLARRLVAAQLAAETGAC